MPRGTQLQQQSGDGVKSKNVITANKNQKQHEKRIIKQTATAIRNPLSSLVYLCLFVVVHGYEWRCLRANRRKSNLNKKKKRKEQNRAHRLRICRRRRAEHHPNLSIAWQAILLLLELQTFACNERREIARKKQFGSAKKRARPCEWLWTDCLPYSLVVPLIASSSSSSRGKRHLQTECCGAEIRSGLLRKTRNNMSSW